MPPKVRLSDKIAMRFRHYYPNETKYQTNSEILAAYRKTTTFSFIKLELCLEELLQGIKEEIKKCMSL
jgi:hypothetical protein